MPAPVRVALDATPLLGARTGVGTFVAGLLDALQARPADVDVRTYQLTLRARMPVPPRLLHQVWLRVDWPRARLLVHGTNFVVPPTSGGGVVTVHDLTTLRFPQLATAATRPFPALVRRAIKRGAWVHTPSSFVAAEVVDLLGADPARVRAIPHGLAPVGSDAGTRPYPFPYILALGTIEPRKGLPTLVRAFDALVATEPDLRLVVAGPPGWGAAAFDEACERVAPATRARIIRLGWVDDRQRARLLHHAAAFAYPSLYEGFGLPPLEAMAAGVPVVATTAGALPEVLGDAAVLVPPQDDDALAGALAGVLTDGERRAGLVERGRRRAAARRWDDTAAAMIDLYRDAASG
ncbi:MAG TPA: glycosyltransferase family 1 protein [Acidimicrobiales bacterium]|nr:glycosyltransferase family 1 protein [Acidimicrobiales bacterium]